MKRQKIASIALILSIACSVTGCSKVEAELTPIALNELGYMASDGNVTKVEFASDAASFENQSVKIYEVEPASYDTNEIKGLIKELDFENKNVEEISMDGTTTYTEDGSFLSYTKNSGTIEYISKNASSGEDMKARKNYSDAEYRNIAETFLKKMRCIDTEKYEFKSVVPSMEKEYYPSNDAKETVIDVIRYEVIFKKNMVDEYQFDGVGPGIKVEIDRNGEICGFLSIDKEFKEVENKQYKTKSQEEIKKTILDRKNVLIHNVYGEDNEIVINDYEYVLYSDPANLKQEYAIPHYMLTAKNAETGEECQILMPAIEDKYISLKQ